MFSKNERIAASGAIPNIIATSMKVSGDLDSEGAVQIEGVVEGDVRCAEVTVGTGGHVLGQIQAETANINGTVTGEIQARRVVLSTTARVTGDILHEELTIEAGAFVEGKMLRRDSGQSRLILVVSEGT